MYVDVLHAHAEQNACTHLTVCMHVLLCTITFRDTETKIADMPKGRKECTAFVLADRIWVVCLLSLPECVSLTLLMRVEEGRRCTLACAFEVRCRR